MWFFFVVAIRHPENTKNPEDQQRFLRELFASLDAQTAADWTCIVVANREQALPPLSSRYLVETVDFPPNAMLERARDVETFNHSIRRDKGRRVRRALRHLAPDDYMMVVDDDDLVSRRLVDFVLTRATGHGWYVDRGYRWPSGSDYLYGVRDFHLICGTSLIVPARFYDGYFDEDEEGEGDSTAELGSHYRVFEKRAGREDGFAPLPFAGAVYRVDHRNATQVDLARTREALSANEAPVLSTTTLKSALSLLAATGRDRLWRLRGRLDRRRIDATLRREFFGA